jgi:hypothetical protein
MAGCAFIAFYLAGKLHLFDQRGHTVSLQFAPSPPQLETDARHKRQFKTWVVVAPMIGAILVGLSRLSDYRHHPLLVVRCVFDRSARLNVSVPETCSSGCYSASQQAIFAIVLTTLL